MDRGDGDGGAVVADAVAVARRTHAAAAAARASAAAAAARRGFCRRRRIPSERGERVPSERASGEARAAEIERWSCRAPWSLHARLGEKQGARGGTGRVRGAGFGFSAGGDGTESEREGERCGLRGQLLVVFLLLSLFSLERLFLLTEELVEEESQSALLVCVGVYERARGATTSPLFRLPVGLAGRRDRPGRTNADGEAGAAGALTHSAAFSAPKQARRSTRAGPDEKTGRRLSSLVKGLSCRCTVVVGLLVVGLSEGEYKIFASSLSFKAAPSHSSLPFHNPLFSRPTTESTNQSWSIPWPLSSHDRRAHQHLRNRTTEEVRANVQKSLLRARPRSGPWPPNPALPR